MTALISSFELNNGSNSSNSFHIFSILCFRILVIDECVCSIISHHYMYIYTYTPIHLYTEILEYIVYKPSNKHTISIYLYTYLYTAGQDVT